MSKVEKCVYCGKQGVTRDHVPPKGIFPKPRPDLITVPSCRECNNDASKDDQYFRDTFLLREDIEHHPDIQRILPTIRKSLSREQNEKFAKGLFSSMYPVDVVTPSGIYLRESIGFPVDLPRYHSVIARTIKGLFYTEQGYRLPNEYDVEAYSDISLSKVYGKETRFDEAIARVLNRTLSTEPKIIGDKAFTYWVWIYEEDTNVSSWLLSFYEKAFFLGMTRRKTVC